MIWVWIYFRCVFFHFIIELSGGFVVLFRVNELHAAFRRIRISYFSLKSINFLTQTQFFRRNEIVWLPAACWHRFWKQFLWGVPELFISISYDIRSPCQSALRPNDRYKRSACTRPAASEFRMQENGECEQLPIDKTIFSDKLFIRWLRAARRQMFCVRLDLHRPYLNI